MTRDGPEYYVRNLFVSCFRSTSRFQVFQGMPWVENLAQILEELTAYVCRTNIKLSRWNSSSTSKVDPILKRRNYEATP